MKQAVYFIPGMSASSKIFERIHLPKHLYDVYYLEWLQPLDSKEPLAKYIDRLLVQIQHPNPIVVGVSFGGIIAQEIALKISTKQVIIISSIKHQQEKRPFFTFLANTKLYRLYPPSLVNFLEKTIYSLSSKRIRKTLETYRTFLPIRNTVYTSWAIHTFLNWKCKQSVKLIHIHGTKDPILPHKYLSDFIEIKNGSHAMILTKSHTLQQLLLNKMA